MNPDSEQVLNRFASGEMSSTEEQDFLALCEVEPERYRRAALAVVEHRRMVEALKAFALPDEKDSQPLPKTTQIDPRRGDDPLRNNSRAPRHRLALAASFAIVAVGGYLVGNRSGWSGDDSPTIGTHGEFATSAVDLPDAENQRTGPAVTPRIDPGIERVPEFQLAVDEGPHEHAGSAHLVGDDNSVAPRDNPIAGVLAQLLQSARERRVFSEQSRERLGQHGWQVDERPEVYLISTDDGHQYAIPANKANIRFIRQ